MPTDADITHLQEQIDELKKSLDSLKTQSNRVETNRTIKIYDLLRVFKLYASLPVYTVARTDVPQNGEIYLTNISGTRKVCAYISGTQYCATIT